MARSVGLVGMPNVGKSTLFNALVRKQLSLAANYPFATVEPCVASALVPDARLDELHRLAGSARMVPKEIKFTDIAGLIRNASAGAGLGSKFLSDIRSVDVLLQVVRCFESEDIIHVEDTVDPVRDFETIQTELVFADLFSVEKRLKSWKRSKAAWNSPAEATAAEALLKSALKVLEDGRPVSELLPSLPSPLHRTVLRRLELLTAKPMAVVCNVDHGSDTSAALVDAVRAAVPASVPTVTVHAQLEAEAAELEDADDIAAFLAGEGLDASSLEQVVAASSALLDRISFFTVGPQEARAWDIPRGATAQQAAGAIHTDMSRGFIRAETVAFDDYVAAAGDADAVKKATRAEGKEYEVQDGDVMLFRFNV